MKLILFGIVLGFILRVGVVEVRELMWAHYWNTLNHSQHKDMTSRFNSIYAKENKILVFLSSRLDLHDCISHMPGEPIKYPKLCKVIQKIYE